MANETAESASLPRDNDSAPIQLLSPAVDGVIHLTATEAADDSSALPSGTEIVRIASLGTVYIAFGGSSIAAAAGESDSFLMLAGVEFFSLRSSTYTWVAARSASGEGNIAVTATKME